MAGYTRQDTADNIADSKTINAADFDLEFDAIDAAFDETSGHKHDGTINEGSPIEKTGPAQEYLSEAAQFRPKTDDTYDLGSATFEWKDLYVDGVANIDSLVADTADINAGTIDATIIGGTTPAAGTFTTLTATGNIVVTGNVDGRDVATDGTKLDGIESGATADQSDAEIKTAYENNADTNAFTDAEQTKLAGIETSADVTDTINVTAAGALMDSELTNIVAVKALDQGVATTDSPTFVGVTATGNITVTGTVDGRDVATDGTKLDGIEALADVTDATNVTAAGALMDSELTNIAAVKALDQGVATTDSPTFAAITVVGNVDGRDVSIDGTKLDTIETNADVTDTANVTAAGALMDSELTNIAAVKALNQGVATTDNPQFATVYIGGSAAANQMDLYEEGTWTPTLLASSGLTGTFSTYTGTYTRVGNLITVILYVEGTSMDFTAFDSFALINGLPYASVSDSAGSFCSAAGAGFMLGSAYTRTGESYIYLTNVTVQSVPHNDSVATVTYRV